MFCYFEALVSTVRRPTEPCQLTTGVCSSPPPPSTGIHLSLSQFIHLLHRHQLVSIYPYHNLSTSSTAINWYPSILITIYPPPPPPSTGIHLSLSQFIHLLHRHQLVSIYPYHNLSTSSTAINWYPSFLITIYPPPPPPSTGIHLSLSQFIHLLHRHQLVSIFPYHNLSTSSTAINWYPSFLITIYPPPPPPSTGIHLSLSQFIHLLHRHQLVSIFPYHNLSTSSTAINWYPSFLITIYPPPPPPSTGIHLSLSQFIHLLHRHQLVSIFPYHNLSTSSTAINWYPSYLITIYPYADSESLKNKKTQMARRYKQEYLNMFISILD